MNTIHFIGGNRGNIGKSFLSVLMCYFYNQHKKDYILFDTDPHKKDVSEIYEGNREVNFSLCNEIMVNHSSDANKVDKIYEAALEKDAIVNMPSDSHAELLYWLTQNSLDDKEFLAEDNLRIIIWWVSNGEDSSLDLLEKTIKEHADLDIILVQNYGIDNYWTKGAQLPEPYNMISILELDILPKGEREATFSSLVSYEDYLTDPKTNKLSGNRIKKYLEKQEV